MGQRVTSSPAQTLRARQQATSHSVPARGEAGGQTRAGQRGPGHTPGGRALAKPPTPGPHTGPEGQQGPEATHPTRPTTAHPRRTRRPAPHPDPESEAGTGGPPRAGGGPGKGAAPARQPDQSSKAARPAGPAPTSTNTFSLTTLGQARAVLCVWGTGAAPRRPRALHPARCDLGQAPPAPKTWDGDTGGAGRFRAAVRPGTRTAQATHPRLKEATRTTEPAAFTDPTGRQ